MLGIVKVCLLDYTPRHGKIFLSYVIAPKCIRHIPKKLHQSEFCENLIIHAKLKGFMQDRTTFSKKFTYISLFHKNTCYIQKNSPFFRKAGLKILCVTLYKKETITFIYKRRNR